GDLGVMAETARRLDGVPVPCEWRPGDPVERLEDRIGVLAASHLPAKARRPARPTVEGGGASFQYVKLGAQMAVAGDVDALVTAPISKEGWDRAGHKYPGHSEFLAEVGGTREWRMMFAGDELKL